MVDLMWMILVDFSFFQKNDTSKVKPARSNFGHVLFFVHIFGNKDLHRQRVVFDIIHTLTGHAVDRADLKSWW